MEVLEPEHYIRIRISRELTDTEVSQLTSIIESNIGDMLINDEVIYHLNVHGDMHCYVFEIDQDLTVLNFGVKSGDEISMAIDEWLPLEDLWEIETSLPEMTIKVTEGMTEQQIFERATMTAKTLLH
jgi:hypothetical protein